ncbi:MAG: hypothetical protein JNJ77_17880 [Planctomycetia bacterium]|nr:hypothetical protein [Planctomycetia bacterium]
MRRIIALTVFLAGSITLLTWGQDQGKQPPLNLSGTQDDIARSYKALEGTLIKIASKLERTGTKEGVEKSRIILRALQEAREKDIAINLTQLADVLKEPDIARLKNAVEKGGAIKGDLEALLTALLSERSSKEHVEYLKQLVKELEKAIRDQKVAISKNQSSAVDKEDAKKAQEVAEKQVQKILQQIKDYEAKTGPKPGEQKDGKPGENKPNSKSDQKDKEQKSKDQQDRNPPEKKDSKPQDKSAPSKDGKPKPGESKDGQSKEGQSKEGEQKEGEQKEGQSKEGQPKEAEGKEGLSGKSKPGEQKEEEQDAGVPRKRIQDANDSQSKAREKIEKNERKNAINDQEDAKTKLEQARKKLEEILRQMREEEIERVLADLQKRCEKMLQMQEIINAGTKQVQARIISQGKSEREDEQVCRRLSEDEDKVLHEADNAIAVIEAEGTAVAFIEVFHQVRNDIMQVSRRLGRIDAGQETQLIEEDIIATLKEMIEAFKKQQQEQRDKKESEQNNNNNNSNSQELIDKLAELRMIKAMQLRVNIRTTQWGKRYEGEQAQEPAIVQELNDLAKRQLRIWNVTDNIAKGRNK